MTARLKEKYTKEVISEMRKEFGYKNNMAVPAITKVVVNAGLGNILRDSKDDFEKISEDMTNILGQKPVITKARKAIAGFKIREGMPVGLTAILRGAKMYEFLDRLINIALPQVRDFRGLNKKAFDRNGNFNIGIKEHLIFSEVNRDTIKNIIGFEINITTTAKTDEEACKLLKFLGFPIDPVDYSNSQSWVDPLIAARIKGHICNSKLVVGMSANIGGFGIGSKFAWEVNPFIGYKLNKVVEFAAAYRWLHMNYESGTSGDLDYL